MRKSAAAVVTNIPEKLGSSGGDYLRQVDLATTDVFVAVEETLNWYRSKLWGNSTTIPFESPGRYWSGQDLIVAWSDDGIYIGRARRAWLKTKNGLIPLHKEGGIPDDSAVWYFCDMAEVHPDIITIYPEWDQGKVKKFAETCFSIWGLTIGGNTPMYMFHIDRYLSVNKGNILLKRDGNTAIYPKDYQFRNDPWRIAWSYFYDRYIK